MYINIDGKDLGNFGILPYRRITFRYHFQYFTAMRNFISINIIYDRNLRKNGIVLSKVEFNRKIKKKLS